MMVESFNTCLRNHPQAKSSVHAWVPEAPLTFDSKILKLSSKPKPSTKERPGQSQESEGTKRMSGITFRLPVDPTGEQRNWGIFTRIPNFGPSLSRLAAWPLGRLHVFPNVLASRPPVASGVRRSSSRRKGLACTLCRRFQEFSLLFMRVVATMRRA